MPQTPRSDPATSPKPTLGAIAVGLVLFQLGLVLATAHVTVALEMGVTLSRHGALVKSLVLLLYPIAVAFLGFGAALDRIVLRSDDPVLPLRGGAVCLLLFLPVSLRLNFLSGELSDQVVAVIAHVIVLAGWFLFAGVALARLLRMARLRGARFVGLLWAAHQVGLVAGYLVADPLLPLVGANALHLAVGLSLLLPARFALPGLLAAALLSPLVDLDERLEGLRDNSVVFEDSYQERQAAALLEALRASGSDELHVRHRSWSRLGQFLLLTVDEQTGHLAGWYNYQPQWDLHDDHDRSLGEFRDALYDRLPWGGRVAILGVGGGRGLLSLPEPVPSYVAIERDPSVVAYFRDQRPEDNEGIFRAVTTVASDGRQFLERQTEPFDVIVFESARYQPASALLPASAPYSLYTLEAMTTVVDRLKPDGYFVAGFTSVRPQPSMEYLPLHIARTFDELGLHVDTLASQRGSHVHVIATRNQEILDAMMADPPAGAVRWRGQTGASPVHAYRLTDRTPFASWGTMDRADQQRLLLVAAGLGLACLLLGAVVHARGRRRRSWNPVPYFFTIGVAQSVLAVATCYLWRTYFTDDVLTVVRVLIYLIAFGAVGSALAHRLGAARLPRAGRVLAVGVVILLHFGLTALVPFDQPSAILRELAGLLLLAPGGLLMGIFFPLGISSVSARHVGRALLADALGALAGYAVLFLVALPFGLWAFAGVAVVSYLLAAALWKPDRGHDILQA